MGGLLMSAEETVMKRITLLLGITVVVVVAACAAPERSRNMADPQTLAQTLAEQVCSNCHGLDGNSISPNFPRLAAQQPNYLKAQLAGFRSHNRSDPAGFEYMWGLSRSLTERQIEGLADYFSRQTAAKRRAVDPATLATGADIYQKGIPTQGVPPCMGCHGEDGKGTDQFPRLAGQHADYLVKQLNVFKRTDERPEGSVMKVIAHGLTNADVMHVAAYLQSR
jgi:cytochrome c553